MGTVGTDATRKGKPALQYRVIYVGADTDRAQAFYPILHVCVCVRVSMNACVYFVWIHAAKALVWQSRT